MHELASRPTVEPVPLTAVRPDAAVGNQDAAQQRQEVHTMDAPVVTSGRLAAVTFIAHHRVLGAHQSD
jgi:hypothetical protein